MAAIVSHPIEKRYKHPAPGTGAADLKEEIRDRLTMGGGSPAQIMVQIDQELDQQAVQASQPVPAPQPHLVGYSPTLQEMRDWLTDARINQRPANYLTQTRELSVDFLADTLIAEQSYDYITSESFIVQESCSRLATRHTE